MTIQSDNAGAARAGGFAQLERVTASNTRATIFLLIVAFLAFLPGQFQIPVIDRDEARYAQATRQMMETGNYLDIRFQDRPRYLQPVGIYWLQAAAAKITGLETRAPIGVHRIPSLLGATAAVALTYWAVLPLAGAAGAFMAAMLMACSVLLGIEARLAKTDATLLAATVTAIGFLARAYLAKPLSMPFVMLFWVAVAAGFLIKGPLVLLVVGTTTLALCAWDRSFAWFKALRPGLGACVFMALVLPWFIAIATVSGMEFFITAIGHSMLGKVAAGQQGHGAPPGYYLVAFWITFAPASLFAITAGQWAWQNRQARAVRFCLAWIVPTWVVFELIVTKLPHYVLPTYPAIATLIALALLDGRRPSWLLAWIWIGVLVLSAAALSVGLYMYEGVVSPAAIAVWGVAIAILIWAARRQTSMSATAFVTTIAVATMIFSSSTYGLLIPKTENLFLSPRLAAAVKRHAPCLEPQVISATYHQPSVVFLVGTGIRLAEPGEAAKFIVSGGCRIALITERAEPEFLSNLEKLGHKPVLAERVTGLNIGRFRVERIGVYRPQGS